MRLIIFLSLFVTLLLAGCGSDSTAPAAATAPASDNSPVGPQRADSREADETLKEINLARLQGIEAINRAESLALMKVVALPDSTEAQLTKISKAYDHLRKSVQQFDATSADDMKRFIESENAKMIESLKQ